MQEKINMLLKDNEPQRTEVVKNHLLMEFDPDTTEIETVKEISRYFNGSFYETETLSGDTKAYGLSIRESYFNAR